MTPKRAAMSSAGMPSAYRAGNAPHLSAGCVLVRMARLISGGAALHLLDIASASPPWPGPSVANHLWLERYRLPTELFAAAILAYRMAANLDSRYDSFPLPLLLASIFRIVLIVRGPSVLSAIQG